MAKNVDKLAEKLGAEVVGQVPEYSAGAFGIAKLATTLRSRLEPSQGKRPGRPSNPDWEKRSKVPMSLETEEQLDELARLLSDRERSVSRTQVAAQLLEEATAKYFVAAGRKKRRSGRRGKKRSGR